MECLKLLDAESVHCCVTSPPYFNLRDYGTPDQLGREFIGIDINLDYFMMATSRIAAAKEVA